MKGAGQLSPPPPRGGAGVEERSAETEGAEVTRQTVRIVAVLALFLVSAMESPAQILTSAEANPSGQPAASAPNAIIPPLRIAFKSCPYPAVADRLNLQGTTLVAVHVTAKGTVGNVTVKKSSGNDVLDAASVQCAKTWTFRPATRTGTPIESTIEQTVQWVIRDSTPPVPVPFRPPAAPVGWQPERRLRSLNGILVSYQLPGEPGAEQYLSVGAYFGFGDLSSFVAKNDASLHGIDGLEFLRESRTTLCNGEPASELEYSQPGLVSGNPGRTLDVEQVRTVKNGWAYVTTYIRPTGSPDGADAEQWIHAFCGTAGLPPR